MKNFGTIGLLSRVRGIAGGALTASLVLSGPALSAQLWVNGGGAGNVKWSRSDNWNPNATPTNDGTANLVFGGNLAKPQGYGPDMDANWNINSLSFASSNSTSYVLQSLGG